MKTKIAYTTITNEKDLYLEQLLVSLVSLKHHSPDAHVVLVTDNKSKATMTGNRAKVLEYINEIIVPEIPDGLSPVMRSRYLKTTLRQHITGDFLYIDTDTVIASPLEEIDEIAANIKLGIVDESNAPLEEIIKIENKFISKHYGFTVDLEKDKTYFNSGVMLVTDCPETYQFFERWHANWSSMTKKSGRPFDQPPLAITKREFPSLIKRLDSTWNLQIASAYVYFERVYNAKIIHYWVAGIDKRKDMPYIFCSKSTLEKIKQAEGIPDALMPFVLDARTAFISHSRIVTDKDYKQLIQSPFRYMMINYPKTFSLLKFCIRAYMFFPNRIKMLFKKK